MARGLNTITRGIPDPTGATQRAIRALDEAISQRDLRVDELEEVIDNIVAGVGAVNSVTGGSSMVQVSPTTGAVVVNVVPANFTGIPQAGVTNLVSDLTAIVGDITAIEADLAALTAIAVTGSGTLNKVPKWTGAQTQGDSSITDNGSLVTITNPVFVDNNVTLGGDTSADLVIVQARGEMAATQNDHALEITLSGAKTLDNAATLRLINNSSVDTTGANKNAIGVYASVSAVESGGGNVLTNIAGLFTASGGDIAEALRTDDGNVNLNRVSGTTTVGGATSLESTLDVADQVVIGDTDPQTNMLRVVGNGHKDTIAAADQASGKTLSMATLSGNNFGTFDTTAGTLDALGGYFDANASRSAGANNLRCVGVRARARGGQQNLGLWVSEGDTQIDGNCRFGNAAGDTIGFYTTAGVAQQSLTALTDSSGGTANDTVQSLPNPADTPATADALRDDLVANLIPALRNNFADLAAKINAIRTVLRNLGLLA